MKKSNFPLIALIIGMALLAVLLSIDITGGKIAVPVLMLLFMSELGFFVTGAGAFIGAKLQIEQGFSMKLSILTLACCVIAVVLAARGFALWGVIESQ